MIKFNRKYLWAIPPLIFLILIFMYFGDIATYIILAWVLSMIGAPIMRLFRKILPRNTSAILTLFTFLLILIILLWVFVPPIVHQTRNLATVDYESLVASLEEPINDWNQWLIDKGLLDVEVSIPDTVKKDFEETDKKILTRVINLDSLFMEAGDSSLTHPVALIVNIHPESAHTANANNLQNDVNASDSFFDRLRRGLVKFLDPSVVPRLFGSVVEFFGNVLIAIISIFFIAFFFLREQGLFLSMMSAIVPNEYEGQVVNALDGTSKLLIRYFVGIVLQITLITIFVSLILMLLGIKNALLIGFFAALMNVIPYLGPILGAAFGVIITISSNLEIPFYSELLPMLIKVIVVFAVMQMIDNFLLQPTIFSKSVKAHPLEIFIIVLVAAKLGGILGMVIAIPAYTVLRVVAKVFLSEFKIVQRITRGI